MRPITPTLLLATALAAGPASAGPAPTRPRAARRITRQQAERLKLLRLRLQRARRVHTRAAPARQRPACPGLGDLPGLAPLALPGLDLTYELSAVGVRLGRASVRIEPDEGALQVGLRAELTGVFAKLGFGRLDQQGRHPLDPAGGPSQIQATDARADRTITYEQRISGDGRRAQITTRRSDRARPQQRRLRDRFGLNDPVGLLLDLRARQLTAGDQACARVVVGHRLWRLHGRVGRTEMVDTSAGRIRAYRVDGTARRPGAKPSAFSLWISADAWRLPVRFWLDGPLGGLALSLISTTPHSPQRFGSNTTAQSTSSTEAGLRKGE